MSTPRRLALPDLPIDLTLAALAIATGTAVCTAGAPSSSGAVMLAQVSGHSPATPTWRWNGLYTMIVLAVVYALLAGL